MFTTSLNFQQKWGAHQQFCPHHGLVDVIFLNNATEKKANPTRQCGICSRVRDARGKKIRRESRYWCPQCEVTLCVTPFFRVYHTVTNI
ncbi:hypothetical protein NQ318_007530 [Aromia moschata]|uniref:PiggyBac transposable element-derived protein 4 C-terminal zinc-finger domain-containing protein n=1 Tax=Aromia moschata TaxID=1265417 RepID=A0AAV8YDL8_9CUCU|nr:hypothetical protein NQ318_007530 [Aromia moschata]